MPVTNHYFNVLLIRITAFIDFYLLCHFDVDVVYYVKRMCANDAITSKICV